MANSDNTAIEAKIDQCVAKMVLAIMLAIRILLFFLPVVILGPLIDWLSFWRFLLVARGMKYIWTGEVDAESDRGALIEQGWVISDGVTCFNIYDMLFALLFCLAVVLPTTLVCLLADIFTLHKFKVWGC
jgi:hypothetical protein